MDNRDIKQFVRSIASDNLIEATDVFNKIIEERKKARIKKILSVSMPKQHVRFSKMYHQ